METHADAIHKIRSFSRFYTNLLGLLNQHILGSSYSLTEARVMLEICKMNPCTANALATRLNMDRSYMSRIIKSLAREELVTKVQSPKDNRVNFIALTVKGNETINNLVKKSDEQIAVLVKALDERMLKEVTDAMETIKSIISSGMEPISVRNFIARDIQYVISRHCSLYAEEYGLTAVFRSYVEEKVNYFARHYDKNCECLLIAEAAGRPVGSIAIAKADDSTAQLRYFLIEPEMRGKGLGHRLVGMVLDFCQAKGYKHVFLETFSALEAARHIYKSHGFTITSTHENPDWGENVREERWDLAL